MSTHFSWQSAVLKSGCESTTKYVLLVVGTYMNQHGDGAFPSYATIAKSASLNRATVVRHMGLAEDAGWIQVLRRTDKDGESDSNIYAISFPIEHGGVVAQNDHPVAQNDYGSRAGRPGVVAQSDPNTPSITPQGSPQETQPALTADSLQADGIGLDLAKELLAHRKRKKAPLTQRAWNAIKREAGKAGWMLSDAVEKLIEKDWKGFEAEWVQSRGQPGRPDATLNKQEALEARNRQIAMQLVAEMNGGAQ